MFRRYIVQFKDGKWALRLPTGLYKDLRSNYSWSIQSEFLNDCCADTKEELLEKLDKPMNVIYKEPLYPNFIDRLIEKYILTKKNKPIA